ncbi:hypothetical protein TNCT_533931 [Trichonephila clavata]|uniref:C2H2-type domain-containing protein n=1 Tax=Trichonephila clavata TaxID=2740835 RepID=A0A8X6J7U5_TRICU|nr:hypothetical protein TNCT_533931 [Trichonephila clavata]
MDTVSTISPSPVAERTRAAVSAIDNATRNIACIICGDTFNSLYVLKTHLKKHMRCGRRNKAIRNVDKLLGPRCTPTPPERATEDKFRELFPRNSGTCQTREARAQTRTPPQ